MGLAPNRRVFLAATAASAMFGPAAWAAEKLPVVASFSILGDLVANVGGDRIALKTLVGPDGDAHVYQPTPADGRALVEAQIVVVNGLQFEGWMERLIQSARAEGEIIVATKGVTPREMAGHEGDNHGGADPHAWQSVANTKIYVANIRDGLIAADPAGRTTYKANAEAYLTKLDSLENEIRQSLAAIPEANRKLITSHDAFGYFGAAYGMSFIAPQGVSTEAEISAKGVARIIRQIRKDRIPAVFLENISDPRLMKRISDETGAKIGGTLFSDALSDDKGPAATYIDMMRNNVRQLTMALTD